MNKCPNCGTEVEGKFCPKCGRSLSNERLCPNCKKAVPYDVNFCPECGYSFNREAVKEYRPASRSDFWKTHKKTICWSIAALALVLILAIVIPVAVMNRHNGTYYLYSDETYDYDTYFVLKGNKYTDETGYSGDIKFSGDKIEMYAELFGVKDVFASGTIKGDVLTLESEFGNKVYAQNGHTHKFEEQTITEPTCEEEGVGKKVCKTCGYHIEAVRIAPLGHNFRNNVCTRCNLNYADFRALNLEFTLNEEKTEYTVTGIGGCKEDKILAIPGKYEGLPVTVIGYQAFMDCKILTSITIPDSVISIGDEAFKRCTGLTSITIPDSVTAIGDEAFRGCTGLTEIEIPDSVTSIGYTAFYNTAYYNTDSNWTQGMLYLENYLIDAKNLSGSVSIRPGTRLIAGEAFRGCTGLTEIEIPDSVISIGESAFRYCTGLTEITIPDSVISIGNEAFEGCTSITEINIPDSVTAIGYEEFYGCTGLTEIEIPDSMTSIGNSAFGGCTGLTSIRFHGTTEQWSAIKKGSSWRSDSSITEVVCDNGTLTGDDIDRNS